jgi:hypothetical protein
MRPRGTLENEARLTSPFQTMKYLARAAAIRPSRFQPSTLGSGKYIIAKTRPSGKALRSPS